MASRRVFVGVSSRSPYWAQASQAPETIGEVALDILDKNDLLPRGSARRFMVEEKFTTRTHLVFDVSHDDYRPEIHVRLSKGEGADAASAHVQRVVNDRVREIHDLTGTGSVPPFLIDHSNGQTPTFWNPRTLRRAPNPPQSEEGPVEDNVPKDPKPGH